MGRSRFSPRRCRMSPWPGGPRIVRHLFLPGEQVSEQLNEGRVKETTDVPIPVQEVKVETQPVCPVIVRAACGEVS